MRIKQEKLILSFHTTAAAIAMESACLRRGAEGRLIPVPRAVTADCGMAWAAPPEAEAALLALAAEEGIELAGSCVLWI